MLGLPAATEIRKLITKKKVYETFGDSMSTERRKSFDADIARITLLNEVSPASLSLADGKMVHAIFVLSIALRKKEVDKQNIAFIARLFKQQVVLVLSFENEERLALWQTRLILGAWQPLGSTALRIQGLNIDAVWEDIVTQIGGIQVDDGRTLDEQIALNDKRDKLQKEIDKLEKLAWAEKQPKRKMEYVKKLSELKAEL